MIFIILSISFSATSLQRYILSSQILQFPLKLPNNKGGEVFEMILTILT